MAESAPFSCHRSRVDLEDAVCRRAAFAARQREDVAAGEDDGEAVDPFANGAVLERGRTRRAGRHRAAGECAEVGGHRRKPSADLATASPARAVTAHRRRRECDRPRSSIELSRSVDITTSPAGVAPPVSDDCAPTGSTCSQARKQAETSSIERGRTTPLASPPAKCAASSRNRASCAGSRSAAIASVDGGLAVTRDRTRHIVPPVPFDTTRRSES